MKSAEFPMMKELQSATREQMSFYNKMMKEKEMNERFEKLAEQASSYASKETTDRDEWQFIRDEKFAELIVEKCLDVVAMRLYRGTEEICRQECKAIAAEIKQHFGVEE